MEVPTLSIRDLSERTGVPQATLRSWESRYGFPEPVRLPGGHRRYAEADVDAVHEVLRHRRSGLGLEAAVRRVTASAGIAASSLFAEVRRRHPELVPQVLTKKAMLALSRAMEDECCAQAQRPLLLASFQRRHFYRASYARWVELARTARTAIVFADFAEPLPARPGMPVEIAVPYDSPVNREWTIVCEAADRPACLLAWERPGQVGTPDAGRRFEVIWSVDPPVVREAARLGLALADAYRPGWGVAEDLLFDDVPPGASEDLRRASALMTRTIGYLDGTR